MLMTSKYYRNISSFNLFAAASLKQCSKYKQINKTIIGLHSK